MPQTTTKLNKIDKAEDETVAQTYRALRHKFPDAISVSAKEEKGFVELKDKITELLYGETGEYIIPATQVVLINELRKAG